MNVKHKEKGKSGKTGGAMSISFRVREVIKKVYNGEYPDEADLHMLLEIEPHSVDAGLVIGTADEINRSASQGKAEVHAQIGLNLSPCPRNCSFCAFAAKNKVFKEKTELDVETVVQMGKQAEKDGANALFIMTTGDYPISKFVEISKELRSKLKPESVMIANIGDMGISDAKRVKEAGYAGIYHAVRMGEGRDTSIAPETRLKTVEAAHEVGLLIGTCVEPIGPEHDNEEIIEKIRIGRDMIPCYSGAMRRISIPGSSLEHYGMISEYRMGYLVAVVRLAMGKHLRGNCTHEPNILGATAGANLFWAEVGTNPRDTEAETSQSRGLDVKACNKMFFEADFELLKGPSLIYS
jgi:biotin synthase